MSRKTTRRAERAATLRKRLIAGALAALMGLGLAVGGTIPATANPNKVLDPETIVDGTPVGQTTYNDNGLVCNNQNLGFTKTAESLPSPSGTYSAEWGSISWGSPGGEREVRWSILDGWDVDLCVKGGTFLTVIDTDVFDGTTYSHQPYAGLSHLGFVIRERPTPYYTIDCDEIVYFSYTTLSGPDHMNVSVRLPSGEVRQINYEVNENQDGDVESESGFHALYKFSGLNLGIPDVKVPLSHADLRSGELRFPYGQYLEDKLSSWAITWVQFFSSGNNMYFEGEAPRECQGDLTAAGDVNLGSATCELGAPLIDQSSITGLSNASFSIVQAGSSAGAVEVVFTATNGAIFSPSLAGTRDGKTYVITNKGSTLTVTGTLPAANPALCSEEASADVTVGAPTCELAAPNIVEADLSGNFASSVITNPAGSNGGDFSVEFTAANGTRFPADFAGTDGSLTYVVSNEGRTLTISGNLAGPDQSLCERASAVVASTAASCFSAETLDESKFVVSNGVTWVIEDAPAGTFEVVFTAPAGSLFSNGESTVRVTGDLDPILGDEDCVLPLTDVSIAFNDATCVNPQTLKVAGFEFDTERVELVGEPTVTDVGVYVVVFRTIEDGVVFDRSEDAQVDGREVSEDGTTLTFRGTLAGRDLEDCRVLPLVDPFDFVEDCLLGSSFTLEYVEGLTYFVTINDNDPFVADFGGEATKTYTVNAGDYVSVSPSANQGYILAANQPDPLDRTFATFDDDPDCQLIDLPNWPASVTPSNEVCTPLGLSSGSITVSFSTGPTTNPTPVRYYVEYGTAQQKELTAAVTSVAPGSYVVTAVATLEEDSINNGGRTAVFPVTVGAAADQECDLPTLAFTGISGALEGLGAAALLIMLVGFGVLAARRQQV